MGTCSRVTRLVEVVDVERPGLPQTDYVTQRRVPIDQTPQSSIDRRPDRVRADHGAGTGQEFIIYLDKSLRHTRQYIQCGP